MNIESLQKNLFPISIIFSSLMFLAGMVVLSNGVSQAGIAIGLGVKNADGCNIDIPNNLSLKIDDMSITHKGSGRYASDEIGIVIK